MKIPAGMTEEEVVKIIYEVVDVLKSKFRFGYHSIEDMRQEGAKFAIEAINNGRYDESRPLANFLYTHIRNRFINHKRNTYSRNEPPCNQCIFFDPHLKKSKNQCAAFADKLECKKFDKWQKRNSMKKGLMMPGSTPAVETEDSAYSVNQTDPINEISFAEVRDKIRESLPVDLIPDYLRLLDGVPLSKTRRDKVKEAIMESAYYEEI